jgi:competence protein ComEC
MLHSWWRLALSLGGGILWAARGNRPDWWLLLCAAGILAFWRYTRERKQSVYLLLAFLAGAIYYPLRVPALPDNLVDLPATTVAGVVTQLKITDEDLRFICVNRSADWPVRKIRVQINFPCELENGAVVRLRGDARLPGVPRNPGEFDYPVYLARQGIYYTMSLRQSSNIEVIAPADPTWLTRYRRQVTDLLGDTVTEEENAILLGMVLGDIEQMPEEEYEMFQQVGIAHLLAVSGFHVSFTMGLIFALLTRLAVGKRVTVLVCGVVVCLIGALTGWTISVERAVIMTILGLIAYYFGREKSVLEVLGLTALLLWIRNPADLMTISFQLSFLAVWGLIYIYPVVRQIAPPGKILDALFIPLAAQLATWPVVLYHFNLFSPVGIIADILTTYLSCVIIISGLAGILLLPLSVFLGTVVIWPAALASHLLVGIAQWLQSIPGGFTWLRSPQPVLIALYYLLLAGIIYLGQEETVFLKTRRRAATGIFVSLLALWLLWLWLPADFYRHQLSLTFIDIGQGDCLLIRTPHNHFILVDGGGSESYDVGKKTVLPYLRRQGIHRLSWIISSHPDTDHLKGLEPVAEYLTVERIGVPAALNDAPEYDTLKQTDSLWIELQAGQAFWLDEEVRVEILFPTPQTPADNYNEASAALLLRYGRFAYWTGGDLGSKGLHEMLQLRPLDAVTVIKLPHHGSKNSLSPELYAALQPTLAIAQAGLHNLYNHPHPDVMAAMAERDIQVLNSQVCGQIILQTDGQNLSVSTFLSEGKRR